MDDKGLKYINSCEFWKGDKAFGLEKIQRVLKALDNPQDKPRSIHIAGTNGKGSAAVSVSAILGALGYTVGLSTSPHLARVNERVVINGWPISDPQLNKVALQVQDASEKTGVKLTYFEALEVITFTACQSLDWLVVEVGLGGRLDASNVLEKPVVSSIVTIGYDHQDILGETIGEIAAEKAGIIKEGGTTVVGPVSDEALNVISRIAEERNNRILVYGRDYWCKRVKGHDKLYVYRGINGKEQVFSPVLPGKYQSENTGVALAILESAGYSLSQEWSDGLRNVFWPGRLEKIKNPNGDIYLDCAHNIPGVNSLISFIKNNDMNFIEAGFGILSKRNWEKMVDLLLPHIVKWHIMQVPSTRALPVEELYNYLLDKGAKVVNYGSDYVRFRNWVDEGERRFPCFVMGSIYLIGELRSLFTDRFGPLWMYRDGNLKAERDGSGERQKGDSEKLLCRDR